MPDISNRFVAAVVFILSLSVALPTTTMGADRSGPGKFAGAVYAMTNATSGNGIAVFERAREGTLTFTKIVSTGGLGIGDGTDGEGLQSAGAIALDSKNKYLYCCNPGTDTLTVFAVDHGNLNAVQVIACGGHRPISIAVRNQLLYVLNYDRFDRSANNVGNLVGFKIGLGGLLKPIDNSTTALPAANLNPSHISFSPDGQFLALTAKATNQIITYHVANTRLLDAPVLHTSSGTSPFSIAYSNIKFMLVAESFNNASGKGAVSSYRFGSSNDVNVVTASSTNLQTGTGWIATTPNGLFAFASNASSNTISGYGIGRHGALSLLTLDGKSATTSGIKPRDVATASKGHFLYVLNSQTGSVDAFRIAVPTGELTKIGTAGNISTAGSNGLAAW